MYVDKCTANAKGKTYTRYLLRESSRDGKKAGRTRAHVFVVMLSYLLVRELRECWREVDGMVEENLAALAGLCGVRMSMHGGQEISMIPRPRPELSRLFDLADIQPPTILPAGHTLADTKRKLKNRRKLK